MRMSSIRRAAAIVCAVTTGFIGCAAFATPASADPLDAPASACTVTVDRVRGPAGTVVGSATVACPPDVAVGTLSLTIVDATTLATAPCVVVGQSSWPIVAGVGAGEVTGQCPTTGGACYRVKAEAAWPAKTPNIVVYSDSDCDVTCTMTVDGVRGVQIGIGQTTETNVHGWAAVTCDSAANLGNLTLTIVDATTHVLAPCVLAGPNTWAIVAGAAVGEVTGVCPWFAQYRIKAEVALPLTSIPAAYSNTI